eukprot:UN05543
MNNMLLMNLIDNYKQHMESHQYQKLMKIRKKEMDGYLAMLSDPNFTVREQHHQKFDILIRNKRGSSKIREKAIRTLRKENKKEVLGCGNGKHFSMYE